MPGRVGHMRLVGKPFSGSHQPLRAHARPRSSRTRTSGAMSGHERTSVLKRRLREDGSRTMLWKRWCRVRGSQA